MGILSRFSQIMRANMNALLDKADDPEKAIDQYMRSLNSDLGQVKAETAAVLADERRAKRALDESSAEIRKLQRYAERSVEAGDEEKAVQFLERKEKQTEQHSDLQAAYEAAASNAANMKQMQDKLVSDMAKLEARHAELKGKLADASMQQKLNTGSSTAFNQLEEKANQAMNEAMALAELRAGKQEDDLDALLAQLDEDSSDQPAGSGSESSAESSESGSSANAAGHTTPTSIEDELAKIKESLNKKG